MEFANGQQSGEPYSQSEVPAATTKMVDVNQILVAEGMMFLINYTVWADRGEGWHRQTWFQIFLFFTF